MVKDDEVQALADAIYAEKYEQRVRAEGARGNPGAWVAWSVLRRRAWWEAYDALNPPLLRPGSPEV